MERITVILITSSIDKPNFAEWKLMMEKLSIAYRYCMLQVFDFSVTCTYIST